MIDTPNSLEHSASNNMEPPSEKSACSSINLLARNEQCSAMASNTPVQISALIDTQIECTLVFKAPDGYFYFAPYSFVRKTDAGYITEISTVFDLKKDAIIDGEVFSIEIVICKVKNNMFECDDGQKNKICQIKRFPCGTVVKVDHELLSSWGKNEKKKKMNRSSKHVTSNKLAKYLKVYTPCLIFRRTYWNHNKKQFEPENDILFCSNAFRP
ncbi:unnamed protein product, partial [Rotaria sp. Silwood2]